MKITEFPFLLLWVVSLVLRISDILALHWKQILNTSEFTVIEKKTDKVRTIRINAQLGQHIKECYEQIKPIGINAPILVSQKGTVSLSKESM